MRKCPYCGRNLLEEERYCFFCEEDVSKVGEKKKGLKTKREKPIVAYCVKCNKKVDVKDPKYYTMKNKRIAIKGTCPLCSKKVFRIVGMKSKR